jgi:hypothetical protein
VIIGFILSRTGQRICSAGWRSWWGLLIPAGVTNLIYDTTDYSRPQASHLATRSIRPGYLSARPTATAVSLM